ncbi:MAG: DUF885 domain-containing protein [Gammaproteobacteria bacterium]|nr:DUF885 domain-containing protein [Gammaproteobacteria bacterium]
MNEPSSPSSSFEALVKDYYQAWFRYQPEAAVEVGVPGYAHLLTPFGDDDKGALVCLNDELRVSLEELDSATLTDDERVDCDLLYGAALLENQYLLDIESRTPDPVRLLPIYAIYQLTIRSLPDFATSLLARLNAIPEYMTRAKDHLHSRASEIPTLWLESAATGAYRGCEFLQTLPQHPKVVDAEIAATELNTAITHATDTLRDYGQFLDNELTPRAQGEFACGQPYFENLLRYRHFLDIDISQLYDLGQQIFRQTARDLADACKTLFGHDDVAAATAAIQGDHPTKAELLSVYQQQMQAARDFVVSHELVTMPEKERLDVIDTPVFMRHQIPFAAYSDPAPNDPEQHGYYYVTPPADDGQLAEHNYPGLMHTCVHEAWPGHHHQFVTANLNPSARTLPRLLNPSATLYEGWALYCEQLMHEQGFLNRPEQQFILLKDRLWRALRIIIDIEIHTRGTTIEQAADRMVKHLGFPRAQALADLKWYSRAPATPMGYATGWALINAARDRARLQDTAFGVKDFHDRLLSAGSIALPLVIRTVFGEAMWSAVKGMVFSDLVGENG